MSELAAGNRGGRMFLVHRGGVSRRDRGERGRKRLYRRHRARSDLQGGLLRARPAMPRRSG